MQGFVGLFEAYLDVERFNRQRDRQEQVIISQFETYVIGLMLSAMVTALAVLFLVLLSALLQFDLVNAITIVACIGLGFAFFGTGLTSIDIAHQGVILVYGQRIRNTLVQEGLVWLLPFATTLEAVDCRQVHAEINAKEVIAKDNTDFDVDMDAFWKIVDPFKRLNAGVGDIKEAIRSAGSGALVTVLGRHTRAELRGTLQEQTETGDNGQKMTGLEYELTEEINRKINVFGAKILKVFLKKLQADQKLIEQERRIPIEEAQQKAERIQNEHFIAEINRLVNEVGMSPEEATQAFMSQIGKATYNIDQKNFNFNEETRKAVKDIASTLAFAFSDRKEQ